MIIECIIVGLGGFIGSVLRYLMNQIPIDKSGIFPFNTFLINVIGAFLISFFSIYFLTNISNDLNPSTIKNLSLFLNVGICGGFTTFSTFALETTDLIEMGHFGIAFSYVFLSMLLGVIAIFLPRLLLK